MRISRVVVLDMDETLGHFTELGSFTDALEEWLNKSLSREVFYDIVDIFSYYLRPGIFHILRYLKEKKETGVCSKVIIYTNNNGPRKWALSIKSYFEHKLNYKLFDRVISAYKIGNKQIEKCRTTHAKTYEDLLRCSRISRKAKVCFLDDYAHHGMVNNNVFYMKLQPYEYNIRHDYIVDLFLKSRLRHIIGSSPQDAYMRQNEFRDFVLKYMIDAKGGRSPRPLDKEEKRKICRNRDFKNRSTI